MFPAVFLLIVKVKKKIVTSIPLLMIGILSGILMIPTRSSVGTSERRMARIRRASPLPLLMSWRQKMFQFKDLREYNRTTEQ